MLLNALTMIGIIMLVNMVLIAVGIDKVLVAFANIFAIVVISVSFIVGGMIW